MGWGNSYLMCQELCNAITTDTVLEILVWDEMAVIGTVFFK